MPGQNKSIAPLQDIDIVGYSWLQLASVELLRKIYGKLNILSPDYLKVMYWEISMKWISVTLLSLGLAACSGGGSGGPAGKADAAAEACDAFVKTKLEGKQFTLDAKVLAASMKENPDKSVVLNAPIIIEPGLTSEVKQSFKCDARFNADGAPEVTNATFIW